jgi:hypothetical protein
MGFNLVFKGLKVCKKKPISMKWKEDPSKENQGLGEAKKWSWRRKRSNQKPERQCFSGK